MPDHAVVKVPPDSPAAVADALLRLATNETERQAIGRAGWEVARNFSVEAYARGIANLIQVLPDWSLPLGVLDRVGDVLAELHADASLDVFATIGSELSQIFGPDFSQGRPMGQTPGTQ